MLKKKDQLMMKGKINLPRFSPDAVRQWSAFPEQLIMFEQFCPTQ